MRRVRLAGAVVVSVLLLAACHPGDIDSSFGTNGVVSFDLGANGRIGESAVLPGGRIAVPATFQTSFDPPHITLHRLNANGTPDPTFGDNGMVETFVAYASTAGLVVRQPDDKLLVGGSVSFVAGMPPPSEPALVRYLPDGTLDESFGNGGLVVGDFGGHNAIAAILVQPDNKIVAVTEGTRGSLALQLNPDGSADATFGWAGLVDLGRHFAASGLPHILRQPDDKLVIGASGIRDNDPVGTAVFQLLRLTPTGIRDASFGDNGLVTTDFGFGIDRGSRITGLVLRPGGKLLAAGGTDDADGRVLFALARYNSDGTLDSTFGTGGRVTRALPTTNAFNVFAFATQPYGAVVLGGVETSVDGTRAVLARFGPAGDFDTSFGSGGIATSTAIEGVNALTRQSNGALLARGARGPQLARFAG